MMMMMMMMMTMMMATTTTMTMMMTTTTMKIKQHYGYSGDQNILFNIARLGSGGSGFESR
jgi:uncharacterized protein YvpB